MAGALRVETAGRYLDLVGEPDCAARIIPNGLYRHEFYEPVLTDDASEGEDKMEMAAIIG